MAKVSTINILRERLKLPQILDNDLLYLKRCNAIYFSCSKNACSSVKSELWRLENYPKERPIDVSPHNRQLSGFVGPRDIGDAAFWDLVVSRNVPVFALARNPYTRIASCYSNRILRLGMEEYDLNTGIKQEYCQNRMEIVSFIKKCPVTIEEALCTHIEFDDFIEFICQQHHSEMDRHWVSQCISMHVDYIEYDYIGKVEEFDSSMKKIYDLLITKAPYRPMTKRLNQSKSTGAQSLFTQKSKELFLNVFSEDFDRFEYGREIPE